MFPQGKKEGSCLLAGLFDAHHQIKRRTPPSRHHLFSYRIVTDWNKLPDAVVSAPTITAFKNRLDATWGAEVYDNPC